MENKSVISKDLFLPAVEMVELLFSLLEDALGNVFTYNGSEAESSSCTTITKDCGSYSYSETVYHSIDQHKHSYVLSKTLTVLEIITDGDSVKSFQIDVALVKGLQLYVEKAESMKKKKDDN